MQATGCRRTYDHTATGADGDAGFVRLNAGRTYDGRLGRMGRTLGLSVRADRK